MKKVYRYFGIAASLIAVTAIEAQQLPFQNPALSPHERAVDLVGRLTIEEKAQLMLDVSEPIERLGIKRFNWWNEALHGVANQGNVTVFPEPIGMAASFNDSLVGEVFSLVSDEQRAAYNKWLCDGNEDQRFHSISVWTPNINIFRDPRWGRGQETYGEDPYLTSRMGVAVIKGLQGPADTKYRKLYACAKHYAIHSGPESSRHVDNINDVSPRDLWETYMPAFKAAVQKGDVREVMCAYQRWDDEPCCGSTRLLQQILRDEWGFKYIVVSDCGAVTDFWESHKTSSDAPHAAVKGVLAGTDVECGYNYVYKTIPEAIEAGMLEEKDVDERVIRLMEGRFELGEMDDPELVQWSKLGPEILNCKKHRDVSYEMALQSIVLLHNRNNTLPLNKVSKIAVIGPNATDNVLMWGNYNGTPNSTVTLIDGIKNIVKGNKVVNIPTCDLVSDKALESFYTQMCSIDGHKGFRAQFWNNRKREGEPVAKIYCENPVNVTTYGQHSFAPGVNLTEFSGIYETVFHAQRTCDVLFDVEGCSYFEVFVDGKSMNRQYTWRTTDTRTIFHAEAGKEYKLEIRYAQVETYNANLKVDIGQEYSIDYDKIAESLKGIETVIFAGGISARLEGEEMPIDLPGFAGGDRTDIELPAVQRNLLKALHKAGKKVIFVNFSGSAMAMTDELESCDAIVQAWYPGERGGQAIADVIFGKYNPSGKLPVTFYKNVKQLPDFKDYSMNGRTYRYMTDEPLFQFGYGLSYTSFKIGEAKVNNRGVSASDNNVNITLSIPVSNVGKKAGAEVVQVYIKRNDDSKGPLKTLRAYSRIEIKSGETKNAVVSLDGESFETYDPKTKRMRLMPGEYTIMYGTSSADKDLKKITVNLQ